VRELPKLLPWLFMTAAAAVHAGDLTFDSLQRLMQSRGIHSVDELIPALPEELRRHYTLVFASRSLQGASFSNPRVILFGSDALLVVTYNGDPHERGYDVVETMEFDPGTAAFAFREIRFANGPDAGPPIVSAANPSRCAACHGAPARPIWDTPPTWPGVYGERYKAGLSAAETKGIAAFLALQPQHPRYRPLLGAQALADRDTYVPNSRAVYDNAGMEPPNAQLSALLTTLNVRSILSEMAARPAFEPHRYALLAAAHGGCGPITDFYPEPVRAALTAERKEFDQAGAAADAAQAAAKTLRRTGKTAAYRGGAAVNDWNDLRFLAERSIGVRTQHWTLAFERGTYDLSAPDGTLTLEQALFEWVVQQDPPLRDLASYRSFDGRDRYCEHLRDASRRTLDIWYSSPSRTAAAAHDPSTDRGPRPGAAGDAPPLLDRCAACHTGEVGPQIPFADRDALAQRLIAGIYPHGRLLDEILYRLDPVAGSAGMPLGISISADERRGLEQYFLNAASRAAHAE
jgi:hypothetical protein